MFSLLGTSNKSFLMIFGFVVSIGSIPTKMLAQFLGNRLSVCFILEDIKIFIECFIRSGCSLMPPCSFPLKVLSSFNCHFSWLGGWDSGSIRMLKVPPLVWNQLNVILELCCPVCG